LSVGVVELSVGGAFVTAVVAVVHGCARDADGSWSHARAFARATAGTFECALAGAPCTESVERDVFPSDAPAVPGVVV
jgi:hypothetical protein